MYDVLDIARFVINYCNDREYDISNLRLQKLLYFIQAYYLGLKNKMPLLKRILKLGISDRLFHAFIRNIKHLVEAIYLK